MEALIGWLFTCHISKTQELQSKMAFLVTEPDLSTLSYSCVAADEVQSKSTQLRLQCLKRQIDGELEMSFDSDKP